MKPVNRRAEVVGALETGLQNSRSICRNRNSVHGTWETSPNDDWEPRRRFRPDWVRRHAAPSQPKSIASAVDRLWKRTGGETFFPALGARAPGARRVRARGERLARSAPYTARRPW